MRIINKKYLLVILLIGIILPGAIVLQPKENIKLDNVILKQEVKKAFAMYKENGEGYTQVEGDKFPEGYVLNLTESKCIDNNGNELNGVLSYEDNVVTITSGNTTYCYLYFDEPFNLSKMCKKYDNIQKCIEEEKSNLGKISNLSSNIVGDMYRYQGTDNVSNWICFGTEKNCSTNENDIDKYMYRIIGITSDGELELIKETFVQEDGVRKFQWNDKGTVTDCGSSGEYCTWPDSMIFKRLNGISNGEVKGTTGNSNIYIGNNYYEYLNNVSWLDKIEDKVWKYGDVMVTGHYNGDEAYNLENNFTTDNTALGTEPKGKIGLMYMYDYYYAYKTNDDDAGNPQSEINAQNAWIFYYKDGYNSSIKYQWFITRKGILGGGLNVRIVPNDGYVSSSANSSPNNGVRPVFYLKPTISLKQGTIGTKSNPYIINIT